MEETKQEQRERERERGKHASLAPALAGFQVSTDSEDCRHN